MFKATLVFSSHIVQTYNQAMKTAKAQYSEDKKAYDNRTPEQVDAANAAAAAATSVCHMSFSFVQSFICVLLF